MEQLWSQAGATGGNRRQIAQYRRRLSITNAASGSVSVVDATYFGSALRAGSLGV